MEKEEKTYTCMAEYLRDYPLELDKFPHLLQEDYLRLRDKIRGVDLNERDRKLRSNLLVLLGVESGAIKLTKEVSLWIT